MWQGRQDSDRHPSVLETNTLDQLNYFPIILIRDCQTATLQGFIIKQVWSTLNILSHIA